MSVEADFMAKPSDRPRERAGVVAVEAALAAERLQGQIAQAALDLEHAALAEAAAAARAAYTAEEPARLAAQLARLADLRALGGA